MQQLAVNYAAQQQQQQTQQQQQQQQQKQQQTPANGKRQQTLSVNGSLSPSLNRSLSTPSVTAAQCTSSSNASTTITTTPNTTTSNNNVNNSPRIFIANLDYAMKQAEYVPVLRKQLEKHGIEVSSFNTGKIKSIIYFCVSSFPP